MLLSILAPLSRVLGQSVGRAGAAMGTQEGAGGDFGNVLGGALKKIEGMKSKSGPLSDFEQIQMKMWDADEKTKRQRDRFNKESVKHSNSAGARIQKGVKSMSGKAGMLGISTSVSSLLRQSQLFTGLMGAMFQVIGAFIDVLLAPFMPLAFKGVALLAKAIPWVRTFAAMLYWLFDKQVVMPIKGMLWVAKVYIAAFLRAWEWLKESPYIIAEFFIDLKNKIVDLWGMFKDSLATTWEKIKDAFGGLKTAVDWIGDSFKVVGETIMSGVSTALDFARDIFGKIRDLPSTIGDWINTVWQNVVGFFKFDWLRSAIATIVKIGGDVVYGLGHLPMAGKLKDIGNDIRAMAADMKPDSFRRPSATGNARWGGEESGFAPNAPVIIKIVNNVDGGFRSNQQAAYNASRRRAVEVLNSLETNTEIETTTYSGLNSNFP